MYSFKIDPLTMELVCPDGSRKKFTLSADEKNFYEWYAEWRDIGVFYFPREFNYYVEGQKPTYNNEELTDEVQVTLILHRRTGNLPSDSE